MVAFDQEFLSKLSSLESLFFKPKSQSWPWAPEVFFPGGANSGF